MNNKCTVAGCNRPLEKNRRAGLCSRHRKRKQRGLPDWDSLLSEKCRSCETPINIQRSPHGGAPSLYCSGCCKERRRRNCRDASRRHYQKITGRTTRKKKTKLTSEVIAKIAEGIRKGMTDKAVAASAGISRRVFYLWMEDGKPKAGLQKPRADLAKFYKEIEKAKADYLESRFVDMCDIDGFDEYFLKDRLVEKITEIVGPDGKVIGTITEKKIEPPLILELYVSVWTV